MCVRANSDQAGQRPRAVHPSRNELPYRTPITPFPDRSISVQICFLVLFRSGNFKHNDQKVTASFRAGRTGKGPKISFIISTRFKKNVLARTGTGSVFWYTVPCPRVSRGISTALTKRRVMQHVAGREEQNNGRGLRGPRATEEIH